MGCISGVVRWLSWGLLRVLLVVSLIPAVWLEAIPLLAERILRSIVWGPLSSSYGFDHLSGLGVLYCFGLVFVVGFRKWGSDDRV
jgi:hypothetical protein